MNDSFQEVETQVGMYQWNRADLNNQPLSRPLEQKPVLAVTPDKEKTPANVPPETPAANQPPNELQTTPASVTLHPKRNAKVNLNTSRTMCT